ncbi:MAG TPA: NAD(P)H-dependent oxidoreductase [Mobilitalea sp.]|nr:NAD(P)H-dependent oxidoreductase [Mobilitalea sp.]
MKITVINGNTRHGSTWHCMDLFRRELEKYEEIQLKEISLPKDMPHHCVGCFSCFYKGEQACPHYEAVHPIITALEEADLIIMTSPVYAFDVSGGLKALLDHLSYMWLSHRPNPAMFQKVALTITTTAGAGLSHTTKTMKQSLSFWGVKKVYTYKKAVAAMKWEDVTPKKKAEIEKAIAGKAKKIYRTVHNRNKIPYPLFGKFMFNIMKGMQKSNNWNPTDRKHWESQGWLEGSKPY